MKLEPNDPLFPAQTREEVDLPNGRKTYETVFHPGLTIRAELAARATYFFSVPFILPAFILPNDW